MTDESELAGLDPFDLLDREAERIEKFFSGLDADTLRRPSRCEGWSVRDVLAHLADAEAYHRACLDGKVKAFLASVGERGAKNLDEFNAMGIADRAEMSADEVLAEWRAANADSRRRFRERGDGTVDTSVGAYPCRWQAFHVASELATHADDVGVPVAEEERAERLAWRTRVSRFALMETKPELRVDVAGGLTTVTDGTITVALDDADFVEAVAGRLDDTSGVQPEARQLL